VLKLVVLGLLFRCFCYRRSLISFLMLFFTVLVLVSVVVDDIGVGVGVGVSVGVRDGVGCFCRESVSVSVWAVMHGVGCCLSVCD